jgi:hypothetical protein
MNPYIDLNKSENEIIRTFSNDINSDDLLWHRDQEDRLITPIGKTDWKIQLDNKLPMEINEPIFIEKLTWHRLIKGNEDLKIIINKEI